MVKPSQGWYCVMDFQDLDTWKMRVPYHFKLPVLQTIKVRLYVVLEVVCEKSKHHVIRPIADPFFP